MPAPRSPPAACSFVPGRRRRQARPGVPADPIKIGILASRAGVTAPVGQAGLRGTEWWAERVNRGGGILGRRVQLVVEEETNPKDTVERYRKLVLQEKVDVVVGVISTGVSLALGSVVEEMDTPWLAWDGTTQKGVEETIPSPKWAFRSTDNEVEAIVGGILTAKYFKGVKTIAGINNDYSYGHDCWESYQAVLKRHSMEVKPVLELFPKLGETNFTSHRRHPAGKARPPDVLLLVRRRDHLHEAGSGGRVTEEHEGRVHNRGGRPRLARRRTSRPRACSWATTRCTSTTRRPARS